MDQALTFDRTADVSKLNGCNTRGLEYRWDIFNRHLSGISGGTALDFGAGSLRESFDLASRGFAVTSVDIDATTLAAYKAKYCWPDENGPSIIVDADMVSALAKVDAGKFKIITCFDVLEHLSDPTSTLKSLSERLADDGLLFVSVPNGRTLFELAWSIDLKIARATGRHIRPGEPHLQRHSPARWREIIERAGLSIIEHDMQIGFFANNAAALVQVPLSLSGRFLRKAGVKLDAGTASERIIARIAPTMSALDRRTSFLRNLYGWNLFVLAR